MSLKSQDSDSIRERIQDLEIEESDIRARTATRIQEHQNILDVMDMEFHMKFEQMSIAFTTLSNHFEIQQTKTLLNSLSLVQNQVRKAIEALNKLLFLSEKDNLYGWYHTLEQLNNMVSDYRRELNSSRRHRQDVHADLIKIVSNYQEEVIDAPPIAEMKHNFWHKKNNDEQRNMLLKHLGILERFGTKADEILGMPNPNRL